MQNKAGQVVATCSRIGLLVRCHQPHAHSYGRSRRRDSLRIRLASWRAYDREEYRSRFGFFWQAAS